MSMVVAPMSMTAARDVEFAECVIVPPDWTVTVAQLNVDVLFRMKLPPLATVSELQPPENRPVLLMVEFEIVRSVTLSRSPLFVRSKPLSVNVVAAVLNAPPVAMDRKGRVAPVPAMDDAKRRRAVLGMR